MSIKNRGDRIQLLQKVVTKHFTPVAAPEDRSVLEHLIYACCLEDATYDAADEAFHRLQESFFDWNEVRVTTISEQCETLHNLPDPSAAALRIKKNLQSLFETRYSFDLDDLIKTNQGKAVQELEKLGGMTRFVLGYVTQNALGGHSIPVSSSILDILRATEIVSESEAEKGLTPGLERTVPKTKGAAFASCLHQLAVAYAADPEAKPIKAIMKEAGAAEAKKEAKPAPAKTAKKTSSTKAAAATKTATSPKAADKAAAADKKSSGKSASGSGKKPAAKSSSKSTPAKSQAAKSQAAKSQPAKSQAARKETKRKPR